MNLGSVLLQPQMLERMQRLDGHEAFADDLVALLQQLLADPAQLEAVLPAFRGAFEALGERLYARVAPALDQALDELRELIEPLRAGVAGLAAEIGDTRDLGDLLGLVGGLAELLIDLLEALDEAQVRDFARRLHGILTQTLGLGQALLQDELRATLADLRQRLRAGSGPLSAEARAVREALIALLGQVESDFADDWPSLDLDPDRLAHLAYTRLRRAGLERLRDELRCLLENLRAVLQGGGALLQAANPGPFGSGSVGAAQPRPPLLDDRYCWYASWLYRTKRRDIDEGEFWLGLLPGAPDDEVWMSADRTRLILRRAFTADEVLHQSDTPFEWYQAPQFSGSGPGEHFSFGLVGPEFLEGWTQATAMLGEGGKMLGHIISASTSPRELGANIPLSIWYLARFVAGGAARAPLPSFLTQAAGWGVGSQWIYVLVPWLSVILGSLEGKHTETTGGNQFMQWITLLGGDALNAFNLHSLSGGAHNLLLSLWTLINQTGRAGPGGDPDPRPHNREAGGTVTGLVVTLANMLLMRLIPREDYAHPFFPGNAKFYLYWLLCAPLMGVAGGMVGTFAVWALSRTHDPVQFGKEVGVGALQAFVSFILQQYTEMEGDTDDGRYNPRLDEDGNAYVPARQPFDAYPPADTSPYLLPYARGTAQFVGQANQGMFSHMRFNSLPQIYGYDFAHDFGDEVLAVRDGTVVDWFDWIPDDTEPDFNQIWDALKQAIDWASWGGGGEPGQADLVAAGTNPASALVIGPTGVGQSGIGNVTFGGGMITLNFNWNFIVVRHDTQVADHDKDAGGGVVTTYAVYGHGKTRSVRDVFAARGVADPRNIIGTAVRQGEVIMHAGDTGTRFHNHLHMHVLGATAATPATGPVNSSVLTPYTLPFVFKEGRHVIGRDGPLRRLTWYTSDNERRDP